MLAHNMMMVSGEPWFSNPTLKINFENGFIDEVKGTAWVAEQPPSCFINTIHKFGSYGLQINDNVDTGLYFPYSAELEVGNQDFTMACWLMADNNIPTNAMAIMGKPNGFVVQAENNGFVLYVYATQLPTVYSSGYIFLPSYNNWHYVKAGRKGTKLFLNINGNQVSSTIPADLIIQETGWAMYLGRIQTDIYRHYDSFIFVKGVGDDSLDVPTTPF